MWRPAGRRRVERMLYLMAKPPAAVSTRIAGLPRTWRSRPPELLHVTVQPLFDLRPLPPEILPRVIAWCAAVQDAPPFRVTFDRIVESPRTVALRCATPPPGAAILHRFVREALTRDGFALMPYRFDPHVTIAYRPDGQGNEAIAPIGWEIDELLLVESVIGETRHVVHARWPLRPACVAA